MIIAADCLFCMHMHSDLITTIEELMHEKSVCIIIAPKRKGSLDAFIKLVKEIPSLSIKAEKENINDKLSKSPFFKEDEHQPYLVIITKLQ